MVVALEAEVVSRAQSGDRMAFGQLYDTYLPKIYDFSLGMLRNTADAEDVTSDTFLKCVERLGSLKDPEAFRGWLYTIARNSALSLIESRKRAVPTGEHDEHATAHEVAVLPEPELRAESDELRELVWDAAATLNKRDYQVFELTVRHGLSSAEIAPILGVRPAYAYILVNRLKGSVEEALATVLLTRVGRSSCAELDSIVAAYGEGSTPRLRKAVARHAKSCAACGETKRTRASVPMLLAGAAFAAPSAAFAAELASKIDSAWPTYTPPGGGSGGAGGRGLGHLAGAAATVVALSVLTVGVAAQRSIDVDPVGEVEPVVEEIDITPSPSARPEPAAPVFDPPAPTQPPQNTPTIVIVDEGNDAEVDTPEPDEPDRTFPPPTRPPKTEPPPTQPPIG